MPTVRIAEGRPVDIFENDDQVLCADARALIADDTARPACAALDERSETDSAKKSASRGTSRQAAASYGRPRRRAQPSGCQ